MVSVIATFAIVVIAYPIVMRLLARLAEPKREKMLKLATLLSSDETFPHDLRPMIVWMLETTFSARTMIELAIAMPWLFAGAVNGAAIPTPEIKDPPSREYFQELLGCYIACVAAANPLCALIASLEFAALGFILYPLGRVSALTQIPFMALTKAKYQDHAHA